jgi:hypothetical protein
MDMKIFISRLFILLFTYLFIGPAIIFSVLVLGLTSSWKSGLFMLGSALVLQIIVKLYSMSIHIRRKSRRGRGRSLDDEAPPPLSEIYFDIFTQHREQELLIGELMKHRTDTAQDNSQPAESRCQFCNEIRNNHSLKTK